jgi:DNA-binding MarR family transcriptional regulator
MAEQIKLAEKTLAVFNYIKDQGGSAKTSDIMEGLGLEKIASVTGCVNSLVKHGLAVREDGGKTEDGKKITIVNLTEEGQNFVQPEDAE